MLKRKILTALIFALTLLLFACGKNVITLERGSLLPSTGESWTVLVYMMGGDTTADETRAALDDMMSAAYSENINFIAETGGKSDWGINGVYSDYLQRFIMQEGSMFLASQTSSADMGSSDTLTDFLNWGISTYPADHYALIIWGQGGGVISGVGVDTLYDRRSLSTEAIYYSLSNTGKNFDLIGFDASCMSNLELAAAIAPYAKYMAASEDIIMPCGFDYKGMAEYLVQTPSSTGEGLGINICENYYQKCEKNGLSKTATMSVTDLSKVSELNQAFDGMAGMMNVAADNPEYCPDLMRRLTYVEVLGAQSQNEGYTDMADLGNLTETIQVDMGATADEVIRVLGEAVVYNIYGELRPYVKGLGVYFPKSGTGESITKYCDVFTSHNNLTFARKVSVNAKTELGAGEEDYNSSPAYYYYLSALEGFYYNAYTDGNNYRLNIDSDTGIVKEISLCVYANDGEKSIYLGRYYPQDIDLGMGDYSVNIPQECISINGHNVMADRVEKGYNGSIYSVPILLNDERAFVRIFADDSKASIIGVWSGIDANGMDKRDMRSLKFGDKITPLFSVYGAEEMIEGKSFRVLSGASAGWKKIDGAVQYEYAIEDIYGNIHGTGIDGGIAQ